MPAAQAAAYAAIVQQGVASAGERGAMLGILQNLRKASLIAEDPGPEGLTDAFVAASARLRALTRILDQLRDTGEKALVFVEFLDMQELLIPYLQRRYALPRPPLRISGEVSGALRKSRVDQFQKGPAGEFDVMLLSPKAGGVGLTLTAANHVLHLTRWWNPAVEDQCTDRVYRIGQKRPVTVHLPLAIHPEFPDHSFDRNLHALLEGKRTLSRSVLAPPTASDNDIANLFASSVSFGKPTP
jgi:SNF2 family DNA or RNA helicase